MILLTASLACRTTAPIEPVEAPSPEVEAPAQASSPLLVMIVVDQLPIRSIERAMPLAVGGLRRLYEGYHATARYPYIPTETCPGHAAISTGAAPDRTGIVANAWFDGKDMVYCIPPTFDAGLLEAEALADTLVAKGGRVVSLSLKDRAAIMLGGHTPTAVAWLDYADTKDVRGQHLDLLGALPEWKVAGERGWTVIDSAHEEAYRALFPDDQPFEPEKSRVFPHSVPGDHPRAFMATPDAGKWLVDSAIAARDKLSLGQASAGATDMLAISFSHIDVIGHTYTPDSWEMMDGLLRLDQDLGRLLNHLDQALGAGNYTVMLSADHGGAPGGASPLSEDLVIDAAGKQGIPKEAAWSTGDPWVWLPADLSPEARSSAKAGIAAELKGKPGILAVIDPAAPAGADPALIEAVKLGTYPGRSGDLAVLRADGWQWVAPGPVKPIVGTTHGSTDPRDTLVPLWAWGRGVKPGAASAEVDIRAVAPTAAALIGVPSPKDAEVGAIAEALTH